MKKNIIIVVLLSITAFLSYKALKLEWKVRKYLKINSFPDLKEGETKVTFTTEDIPLKKVLKTPSSLYHSEAFKKKLTQQSRKMVYEKRKKLGLCMACSNPGKTNLDGTKGVYCEACAKKYGEKNRLRYKLNKVNKGDIIHQNLGI